MNVMRLFTDAVIGDDACIAQLIRRASGFETVCSDVIEGPDQVRLTVQIVVQTVFYGGCRIVIGLQICPALSKKWPCLLLLSADQNTA